MTKMTTTQMLTGIRDWVLGKLSNITSLIPSQASAQNQLADKAFVNSSIATSTATFRGSWNLVSDLELPVDATRAQVAQNLKAGPAKAADENDYTYVQIPVDASTPDIIARVDRYKAVMDSQWYWEYEYSLNNSGFTAAQWAAINSGATLELMGKLSALPTNSELATLLNGKAAKAQNPTSGHLAALDSNGSLTDSGISIGDNGAYDVTAHNSGATFASLSALLSDANLSTLIPSDVRKGGMSIKYVCSFDNKYVQARCMAQNFTSDVTQWQGVDTEIKFDSKNIVEGSAVYNELHTFTEKSRADYDQTGWSSGYRPFVLTANKKYKLTLTFTNFTASGSSNVKVFIYASASSSAQNVNITSLFGINNLLTGNPVSIEFTPTFNVNYMDTYGLSNYVPATGCHVLAVAEEVDTKYAETDKFESLKNSGYLYAGIATTSTNPGTPTNKIFYLAKEAGTYSNFIGSGNNALVITNGINVLKFSNNTWSAEQLVGIDTQAIKNSHNLIESAPVKDLYDLIYGPTTVLYTTPAYDFQAVYKYAQNPCNEGDICNAIYTNPTSSWMSFGFAKTSSATWGTSDVIQIFNKDVSGNIQFIAPSSTEYPYIIYKLSGNGQVIKIQKKEDGILDNISKITEEAVFATKQQEFTDAQKQVARANIGIIIGNEVAEEGSDLPTSKAVYKFTGDSIDNSLNTYETEFTNTFSIPTSTYQSNYKSLRMAKDVKRLLSIRMTGFSTYVVPQNIILYQSASASATHVSISSLLDYAALKRGEEVVIEYTPSFEVNYVNFAYANSTYRGPEGNSITLSVIEKSDTYVKTEDIENIINKDINAVRKIITGQVAINVFGDVLPPAFKQKLYDADNDILIACQSHSLFGQTNSCSAVEEPQHSSPFGAYNHFLALLQDRVGKIQPYYNRLDSQRDSADFFEKTGTWDEANQDTFSPNGTPSIADKYRENSVTCLTYRSNSTDASASFVFDADVYEKCNIIFTKNIQAASAIVTVQEGNGKLLLSEDRINWVEANGYTHSQALEAVYTSDGNPYVERHRRLWMKRVNGVTGELHITYAKDGSDSNYMYFWGTEMYTGRVILFDNLGRSGRTTELLADNIGDLFDRKPDLCIIMTALDNDMYHETAWQNIIDYYVKYFTGNTTCSYKTRSENFTTVPLIILTETQRSIAFNKDNAVIMPSNVQTVRDYPAYIYYKKLLSWLHNNLGQYDNVSIINIGDQFLNEAKDRYGSFEAGLSAGALTADTSHYNQNGANAMTKYLAPIFQL